MGSTFLHLALFLIALTVVWLAIAVLALYRREAQRSESRAYSSSWPSDSLVPGQALPPFLLHRLPATSSPLLLAFAASGSHSAWATVTSGYHFARMQGWNCVLAHEGKDAAALPAWSYYLKEQLPQVPQLALSEEEFRLLGFRSDSPLLLVTDGRILHGISTAVTPSAVEESFSAFAPSYQQN